VDAICIYFTIIVVLNHSIMRVLNISSCDYANYSHDNARALRSIGVDVVDYCTLPHTFRYKTASEIVELHKITSSLNSFDAVQVFHSDVRLFNLVKGHKNIVIYHTGSKYRQQPEYHDSIFKGQKIATDQCEFLLRGDFFYIAPHTDLKPRPKRKGEKLIVGHYPSLPIAKGTALIESMLKPFKKDFDIRVSTQKMVNQKHLQRVSECHIYIELFAPFQDFKPYGCFGTSAFEATAMGSLVVTNNINRSAYESVYGQHPFLIPNTERDFKEVLAGLTNKQNYLDAIEIHHEGFHDKHSIEASGYRILEIINQSK